MAEGYDSRPDTIKHILDVQRYLGEVLTELGRRSAEHDRSKLVSPEVEVFDRVTPRLAELTYGSEEYRAQLDEMGAGLAHHYAVNRHHPEHFEEGVRGMSLIDLIEMLADWKAATLRHGDGDLDESIRQNAKRFWYGPDLERLLTTTARDMGWLE